MKRIVKLLIIILLVISFNNVYASTKTYERKESNNYGVNKDIEITEDNLEYIKSTKLVNAKEKIYDFSNILSDDEEKELKKIIDEFISITNMDMVILTDRVVYDSDIVNDYYALDFYDYNDFGIDYKNYDGVILFRNTYEQDRYYNIYTTGNAQLYFDYNRCEYTLDDIYDYFVNDNYLEGMTLFINKFINYYNNGKASGYSDAYIDDNGNIVFPYKPPYILSFIISTVVVLITMGILVSKNKMVYKAKEANTYLNRNTIKYNKKDCRLISTHTTSHYNPPSSSSGSGGSHSGSSGISHGGGGGRHG